MKSGAMTLLVIVALVAGGCSNSPDDDGVDSDSLRAAGAYSAVVEFLLGEQEPTGEPGGGLGDRAAVFVLDRIDLQVGSFFCDPVDEFGENPAMCADMASVSDVVLFPASVQEAVEAALPATTRVEFVDDIEQVTEPAHGIELTQVIDDGGLLQFGPMVDAGSTVHLTVRCSGCSGGDVWLLRLEETGDAWSVEPETVAIF